ncbi:hypothetical protein ASF06_12430 [Agreia sp. Leaf244]|uniref:DUF1275 family protein n=1 Tax=Agreia sp. Leaf244 TaxID=1736305 RepID=UPI0006FB4BE7|nr:DUF1275 family protein [Agreia sp. Leaf244]KQO07423.1 hypothetical protein ASF06_12430 [Agreia sp. Leaf244]
MTAHRSVRLTTMAVVLAFAAGATDAFAFLQLLGVFTANMTGNLVLAGLTERSGYSTSIGGILVALVVFVVVLYVAFRAAPNSERRGALLAVLAAAALAQLVVLVIWAASPGTKTMPLIVISIGLSASAMACQTVVAKRLDGESGVTTTYVTGTLTSIMADAADRRQQDLPTRIGVVAALVLGALSGSLLIGVSPSLGAALPVVPAVAGLLLLATTRASR